MRRALVAVVALAVLAVPGVASAVDDDGDGTPATTTAPTTSAAPTSARPTVPGRPSLLDILEALYGPGVFDGCCGVQPTPQPSPGYRPPPNTLTPPPPATGGGPYTVPTYSPGPVAPGGGTGAAPSSRPAAVPTVVDVPGAAPATATGATASPTGCVPNSVRGSAGYSVVDDPDGDGVSCTPVRPAGYADPPAPSSGTPSWVVFAAAGAALVLGWVLAVRPRIPGRHRPRGARP